VRVRLPLFLLLPLASCAPVDAPVDQLVDQPAEDDTCAFDDDVVFDPQGGLVLQAANDVACARIERAPLAADARRGTEWRALSLHVVIDGVTLVHDDALAYENSHHNCLDAVTSGDDVRIVIDGAQQGPDVCFLEDASAWRLVLTVLGEDQAQTLVPHEVVDVD
jgi:hypothetical protein